MFIAHVKAFVPFFLIVPFSRPNAMNLKKNDQNGHLIAGLIQHSYHSHRFIRAADP